MSEVKGKNRAYLFLLLLVVLFLILKVIRGTTISDEQGGIWNVIQVLFVGIGVYLLLSSNKSYRSIKAIRYYIVFFIYIWLLASIPFLTAYRMGINEWYHFLTIPYGVMVLLTFYSIGNKVDIKQYSWILWCCFAVISILFFNGFQFFRSESIRVGTTSDVYYIVGLLPFILINTVKRYRIVPFLIVFACILMSNKRGAFIIFGSMMVIYYIMPSGPNKKTNNIIGRLLLVSIVLAVAYYFMMWMTSIYNFNMLNRMEQIEEDGGSGRLDRWSFLISEMFNGNSTFRLLFGFGNGAVLEKTGGRAHNDFVQFLFDYGVIAVILYIVFYVALIKEGIRMYKHGYLYTREYFCTVATALGMSLYSFYAIDCTYITSSSFCFGIILADWNKYKKNGYGKF